MTITVARDMPMIRSRTTSPRAHLPQPMRFCSACLSAWACVECILKALILSMLPESKRKKVTALFFGSKAHDYDWLKARYFENGGPRFPKAIAKAFSFVNTWAVEIRYKAGTSRYGDAKAFLDCAEEIMIWADGRMYGLPQKFCDTTPEVQALD